MQAGDAPYRAKRKALKDPASGREVWQMTPEGRPFGKGYMYLNHFSPDERFLFVVEAAPPGRLFRIEIETGEAAPLTREGVEWTRWNAHPFEPEVFYRTGPRVFAVHVETREERLVHDAAQHEEIRRNAGGPITFSGDGRWFSLAFVHDARELPAPEGWSHWTSPTFQRCGAARAPCAGGAPEVLYLHSEGMQHLMFCPADARLLTFAVWPDYQNNARLADNHRARAWLVDARRDVARPYLVLPKGQRATHEFWSRDGDRLFYHWKTVPGWLPNGLGYLDRATESLHEFYTDPARRLSHSAASGDARWVVSNCVERPGRDELVLVEVPAGRAQTLRCPHGENPDAAMSVPSLSRSGRYIVYACDGSGESRVYLVPLEVPGRPASQGGERPDG